MKKKQLLAASLALAGITGAYAQSTVTLYGLTDVAVERITNANATGASLVRMPNLAGGMFPSRLGFRGTESLGGGLNAVFTLEQGIAVDSGNLNQGGRAFGRQAFVGLTGSWGALSIGRQYTMLGASFADADIMGPSQYGLGSLDPYLPSARVDNAIGYRGTFGGISVGATYSLGRDNVAAPGGCAGESATDKQACREQSLLLRYDAANWGVGVAYDRLKGSATTTLLASSNLTDTRVNLGGYFKFGPVKIGGGLLKQKNEGIRAASEGSVANAQSNMYYLGAAYSLTPAFVIDGQIARFDLKNSANDTNMAIVRGVYSFSKRTAVYALVGRVQNHGVAARSLSSGGTVGAGMSQTGLMTGIKHSF